MRNRMLDQLGDSVLIPLGQPIADQVTRYVCEEYRQVQQELEIASMQQAPVQATSLEAGTEATTPGGAAVTLWSPTPEEYVERLRLGQQAPPGQTLAGLCGRVCRGQRADDFLGLAPLDGQRKVVFMLGADGLEMVLRERRMPLKLLLNLGYDILFLYEEIQKGTVFELVVCSESDHAGVVPATWDAVPHVVHAAFDDPRLAELVETHLPVMRGLSFADLQQGYTHPSDPKGAPMSMNEARGKPVSSEDDDSPPWRMTERRLLRLASPRPADVRAFLYHALNLNNLFSGDGYTYTQDGSRGFKEYLAPNKQIERLGVNWAMCPIGLPSIDDCMQEICSAYELIVLRKVGASR